MIGSDKSSKFFVISVKRVFKFYFHCFCLQVIGEWEESSGHRSTTRGSVPGIYHTVHAEVRVLVPGGRGVRDGRGVRGDYCHRLQRHVSCGVLFIYGCILHKLPFNIYFYEISLGNVMK